MEGGKRTVHIWAESSCQEWTLRLGKGAVRGLGVFVLKLSRDVRAGDFFFFSGGGGSFVAFPALLFTGVPPVPANATNTLALWVGTTASGGAYRMKLNIPRRVMIPLIVTSVIGGVAGALLLIKTPAQTFLRVLPWLMLGATLLFAFGKRLTGRISAGMSGEAGRGSMIGATIFELAVALYGGYFGGGMGILNLAMLSALGMTDIHAMNKLKVILGSIINGVAAVAFIASGFILWPQAG